MHDQRGQGTFEFALVTSVIIVVAIALYALCSKLLDGTFVEHASACASHTLNSLCDIVLY